MAQTIRERHNRRLQDLKTTRNEWEDLWTDVAEHTAPDRIRLTPRAPRGKKNRKKIIDSVSVNALRVMKSGMHSGVTSPARPWFRYQMFDPELREYGPVKEYLDTVEQRMRQVLSTSNVYDAFHAGYGDLGCFGQSCGLLVVHPQDYIHMHQLVHGEFWLANDPYGFARCLYRYIDMTTEQIMKRFGDKGGKIPRFIQNLYDNGDYDTVHTVYNAVEEREDRDPSSPHKSQKPWMSNYWFDGSEGENEMLEISGYDHNPIIAPRWEPVANDPYSPSPGMEVLSDVKAIQHASTRKSEAIDKKVRPPMKGPSSLRNQPRSMLPGSITYVDDPSGQGYTPAFMVNFDIRELKEDIAETRERVKEGFYANLFLMLQNMEGVQPRNVLELTQRKEEQLLQLGPVLERVYREQLRPTLAILFAVMNDARILPPPPPEARRGINIDFISTLAQAQKAVATGAIERLAGFVGNLAGAKPDVLDKFDADQAVDVYADLIGSPPSLVVSDDKVKEVRAARAQQQQQMAQAEMASKMAPAAKDGAQAAALLAGTDAGGGVNAQQLLSSLGIAG